MDPKTKIPLKMIKPVLSGMYNETFGLHYKKMDEYLERLGGDMKRVVPDDYC